MLAKQPPEPFMVDRLAGPFFKLRENPAVAVFRVLLYDLSNLAHQFLIFFAWAIWALLSVVVGTLRQTDRPKAPVESAFFSVLIY
jgi:hypothetical protein